MTAKQLKQLALSEHEYKLILDKLGRKPNELELGLFSAMWSEHCGYKHTKALIRKLAVSSKRLLTTTGSENAGAVDLGDGLAVVMKVESHNHPSAIDPYEGAATGVGGIVRDIFAMGARPIALLNSLRFGLPHRERQMHLFDGVVSGIAHYGNCIGVPDVGGELVFDECYSANPLVNAMCVGVVEDGTLAFARAEAAGDLLVLVGADTGKDGIHGASALASRSFEEEETEESAMRSTIQVSHPFLEKLLIESCLEAKRCPAVIGIQDCGAAGITSSAVEMARNSRLGLKIDVTQVPCRSTGMTPYEIMLSESQERMLLAVKPDGLDEVTGLFRKWELGVSVIGEFQASPMFTVLRGPETAASIPIEALTSPPEYTFDISGTEYSVPNLAPLPSSARTQSPKDLRQALLSVLGSPNTASRHPVYRQYDHQVQTNTVTLPGTGAAVLRIKNSERAIAVSLDGNGRYCQLDPYTGALMAVAEACRNLVVVGAQPVALTDGLNFGDPGNPDVRYQLVRATDGIAEAAGVLDVPVISGNASLYNQSGDSPIYPTPIIGALGLIDDVSKHVTAGFKRDGDIIAVMGAPSPWDGPQGMCGSEYAHLFHCELSEPISIDIHAEAAVQKACLTAIRAGLLQSAHDCSLGGMAVAIAKCSIFGMHGAKINFPLPAGAEVEALFGESPSRILISIAPHNVDKFESLMAEHDVAWAPVGTVGGNSIEYSGRHSVALTEAKRIWLGGLDRRP